MHVYGELWLPWYQGGMGSVFMLAAELSQDKCTKAFASYRDKEKDLYWILAIKYFLLNLERFKYQPMIDRRSSNSSTDLPKSLEETCTSTISSNALFIRAKLSQDSQRWDSSERRKGKDWLVKQITMRSKAKEHVSKPTLLSWENQATHSDEQDRWPLASEVKRRNKEESRRTRA